MRTKRRLAGAVFIGMAANFALGFVIYDQHGAHLLPSLIVGFLVGVGVYYLSYANDPDQNSN
jgi:hypothetical protein